MQKPHFEGKILFSSGSSTEKKTLMPYYTELLDADFEQTIMPSFNFLDFSPEEKKKLSSRHRKTINHYRLINPFTLNLDALTLIENITNCKSDHLTIDACDYGAYICLAALYSGKLPKNKKIEFRFENSPLALFPSTLLHNYRKNNQHKIYFMLKDDSWMKPFTTLYSNDKIKCSYLKTA